MWPNDRFLQILNFPRTIIKTIVWVKNEPLNIYFDDQYQLKIKFNSENCTIEIERIHVGRNGAAEEILISILSIDGVKRDHLIDTHLQPETAHDIEKIPCGTTAPYEELFMISKYTLGVAKYSEMEMVFEINRGT